ncbi:MAG: WD40/YVTN/BNR-like repeat-containing protein [Bacillota bacterium]
MKKARIPLLLFLAAILLSGCTISIGSGGSGSGNPANDGGVWVSGDKGATWRQMSLVPTVTGKPQSLGGVDVKVLSADPEDSAAVYLGTYDRGLYYTYNVNNGWNSMSTLRQGTINDVRVDPKNKCSIFSAIDNRLFRSQDCGRSWQEVYYDNNPGVSVTAIAIDHFDSDNLYIGTSRGDVLKSIDHGTSWRAIQRVDQGILRIVVSPLDSRRIFVATSKNNIYSFYSNTATDPNDSSNIEKNFAVTDWQDVGIVLKDFQMGNAFRDIVACTADGTLFLASDKAIVRSPDQGITWENITLLQPEKDAVINAVAVNPKDSKEIFYVTNTAFFRSSDGGVTWTTKKLPTSRAGSDLLVDSNKPEVLYLGVKKLD